MRRLAHLALITRRAWPILLILLLAGCSAGSDSTGAAAGRITYEQNCAKCHGDAATGEGVLPDTPVHGPEGHTWHHADRLLVDWILDGVPLATVMPTWRGRLTEDEVRAVVAYIKTFWPESIQQQQIRGSEHYEQQVKTFGE